MVSAMTQVHRFGNGPLQADIRIVRVSDELRFFVTDLARTLGYRDAANAKRNLRDSQLSTLQMSTWAELGGRGSAPLLTTEGGLYRLALRSQRPEAEEFQAWVEDEVLPTLRRTGGYISDEATREQLETLKLRMSQRLYELEGDVAELSIKNTETGDVRQKQESQLRALQRWVRVTCGRVPTKAELKGYM